MAVLQEKNTSISIIIVNYLSDYPLLNLLKKISKPFYFEIIVVNNGSAKNLKEKIHKINKDIIYHANQENVGFAKAVNIGISLSHKEWILLLNSDIDTDNKKIIDFVTIAKSNGQMVATPKLINLAGLTENNVGYYNSLWTHPINWLFLRPKFLNCEKVKTKRLVDLATGGVLLINRLILDKIGLLDERFFMYFEDMDFCYRLKKSGIKVLYIPDIKFIHFGNYSANKNLEKKNNDYKKSLQQFIKKHRGNFVTKVNDIFQFFN